MPMNPNFLCCIGAELKNSTQQTTRMTQVYLYRAFENDTLSDMLSAGFFNEAVGVLRQDDLLLLYSPNETTAKWTYARVSNVDRDGVTVAQIGMNATAISVDTTGYSNISGNNLQEIIDSIDSEFSKYVKIDGTSIMTGPLKMRSSVSFKCAIAPSWDGVGFYKLNDNDSLTLMASMETTDGLCPATNNTYNIGKTNYKWKDAYIARVITAVINNGYDIAVPVTNSADTLALKSQVDDAANSGEQLYTTGVWFAKMYSASTVPTGAEYDGKNYADFSQVDNDNNPIVMIYEGQSGSWVEIARITPPANHVAYLTITSKIWDIAEQTDQQGGEVLWSYNQKTFTPYPKIVSVDGLANTDLSNLTDTGKNIANWSSNVSNCITEIPQDIKLELNAGTLTLKAGSKVYVPNGAGVFDEVVTNVDKARTGFAYSGSFFLCLDTNGSFQMQSPSSCASGSSVPASFSGWFYNTTDNTVKEYQSGTYNGKQLSFPICIFSADGTNIIGIDQVFNGFGYIGSTVFVLPGVKGLIPNGRNADGSLKNTTTNDFTTVKTVQINTSTAKIAMYSAGGLGSQTKNFGLNEQENFNYDTGVLTNALEVASVMVDSNEKITAFTPKTVFHAVDYNDTEYIAHQAMPSDRYVDLTLPASGNTITVPADGWLNLRKVSGNVSECIELSGRVDAIAVSGYSGQRLSVWIPVSKGENVEIWYNASGTTEKFRFVYANGAH